MSKDEAVAIIEGCAKFASEVTSPLNSEGDRLGCEFDDGNVTTPPGFKDAWKQLYELGLLSSASDAEQPNVIPIERALWTLDHMWDELYEAPGRAAS